MNGLTALALCAALAGLFLGVAPLLPKGKTWARTLLVAIALVLTLRYLAWRLLATIVPASLLSLEGAWYIFIYAFELLLFFNQFLTQLVLTRFTDRSNEADRYEAELRGTPAEELPSVDVFICTYNEELDVLERTIVAALAMDYPKFMVWVLDDGNRDWLQDFCVAKGSGYIRRAEHRHAKAGNINHALTVTHNELFAVLDADFVPFRNFLYRTVGFFRDPKVGILQTPQHFFNPDPMQLNLGVAHAWPDDQRLFFDVILPARDAWDCAWCCGSCSVQRRDAIVGVGGVPTDSITEDMLSTLVLLRKGYVTRYLNERLSVGLAPENLEGFFRQRERWCRGNLQTLFLKAGPFGPGLSVLQRLLFLPIDWVVSYLARLMAIIVPIVFLWTGVGPFLIPSLEDLFCYQLPVFLAVVGVMRWFAPNSYLPIMSTASALFGSFRIVPTALATLIKPFGTPFQVTPKGSRITFSFGDVMVLGLAVGLMLLTLGGLVKNRVWPGESTGHEGFLLVSEVWALVNVVLLGVVALVALESRRPRKEERFPSNLPATLSIAGCQSPCLVLDISASGALLSGMDATLAGDSGELILDGLSPLPARVVRTMNSRLALQFEDLQPWDRDRLIHYVYAAGRSNAVGTLQSWKVICGVLRRIVKE